MITRPNEYWDLLYRICDKNNTAATSGQIPPILLPSDEPTLKIDLNTRKIDAPEFLSVMYDHKSEILFFEVDRYYDGMDLANTCCVVQYLNANPKKPEGRIYAVPFYDTVSRQYLPIEVTEEQFNIDPSYYYISSEKNEEYVQCTEYAKFNSTIKYYKYQSGKYILIDVTRVDFEANPTLYYTKKPPMNFVQCGSNSIFNPSNEYYYQANKMLIPWEISGKVTEYAGIVEYAIRFYTIDGDLNLQYSLNTLSAKSKVLHGIDCTKEEVYDDVAAELTVIYERLARLEGEYNLYWLEVQD